MQTACYQQNWKVLNLTHWVSNNEWYSLLEKYLSLMIIRKVNDYEKYFDTFHFCLSQIPFCLEIICCSLVVRDIQRNSLEVSCFEEVFPCAVSWNDSSGQHFYPLLWISLVFSSFRLSVPGLPSIGIRLKNRLFTAIFYDWLLSGVGHLPFQLWIYPLDLILGTTHF